MEQASCNVIYVDRRVSRERHLRKGVDTVEECAAEWAHDHVTENVGLLLEVFGEVHLCSTGGSCLLQWLNLQDESTVDLKPTLILIDTPFQEQIPDRPRSRNPSPHSLPDEDVANHEEELYGLALLQRIEFESSSRNLSKLVVPVPVVNFLPDSPDRSDSSSDVRDETANEKLYPASSEQRREANRRMMKQCLDLGAIDVMASPLNVKCITNLEVHAYRAHREAAKDHKAMLEVRRGRKRSWVGIDDARPFSYLREAMVQRLMNRICKIGIEVEDGPTSYPHNISVSADKQAEIRAAVGRWHFCAHDFNDDELVIAAAIMFQHALSMPELEKWRISTDQLHSYLLACRRAYIEFVPYHNFRHVVDVLQATFNFLIHIGSLPPFSPEHGSFPHLEPKSPMARLLRPFEALTLLITAIGHDVGHPGVNNGFLVTLNAPLAQLYNDRSVLESFHCAAYSQILRRYWPAAFGDGEMRKLMISSILATDMGLHFDYMKKMSLLREELRTNGNTNTWDARTEAEQKSLACALLIKCADISNVARKFEAALNWMHNLADEFSRQASMETELAIPSALIAVPKKDALSLAKSQLGFMNMFAIPLFEGVADILPTLRYCVDQLLANKGRFEDRVKEESEIAANGDASPSQGAASVPASKLQSGSESTVRSPPHGSRLGDIESSGGGNLRGHQHDGSTLTPPRSPRGTGEYNKVNGITGTYDAVADFAQSDPFNINDCKSQGPTKQRCSETTEGSVPYCGDWASQATSATTGKMPLSPSTQGTSIVSTDSLDHTTGIPVATITAPEATTTLPESAKGRSDLRVISRSEESNTSSVNSNSYTNGPVRTLEAEPDPGKTVKKRPSRFRINDALSAIPHFFRKPKSTAVASDTAG
ncbi:HD-domain/PDEase-like protein [Naviculisporaceae sp. PSN 640]